MIVPGNRKPFSVPAEFGDYFKLMTDMLFIAFQADHSCGYSNDRSRGIEPSLPGDRHTG